MTAPSEGDAPPAKRRRLEIVATRAAHNTAVGSESLARPVSPPASSRQTPVLAACPLLGVVPTWSFDDVPKQTVKRPPSQEPPKSRKEEENIPCGSGFIQTEDAQENDNVSFQRIPSPFHLTHIQDLAPQQNVDTLQLKDVLDNPLIKECWNFNFLFDIDFVMQQFDEDVRHSVKVKIIHGFWKRDDERRIDMMETAERYPNLELISAYLPDPFGTHHSKMLILFRHDDFAQVIIHTANMISKDWMNMTQAVWRSPLLPISTVTTSPPEVKPIGTGNRFQVDLLQYLHKYEKRLRRLTDQLSQYDFSNVRAAFLGSAPSRQFVSAANPSLQTSFGWLGLQEILSSMPNKAHKGPNESPHIVMQVSSIATLGAAPTWLSNFQSVLARPHDSYHGFTKAKPKFNVVFPTPEEVRTSLDGYASGGSIHTKIQSAQQQKQLQYLHPLFCHWKHQSSKTPPLLGEVRKEAHRGPAAPHIKTYIRFSDHTDKSIDWALVTSANLSKQAWGDVINKQGEVRIQSYEAGVVVWPELFADRQSDCEITMVPTFGTNMPDIDTVPPLMLQRHQMNDVATGRRVAEAAEADVAEDGIATEDEETEGEGEELDTDEIETEDENEAGHHNAIQSDKGKGKASHRISKKKRILVGFRMPYDLPLSPYSASDVPWCATQVYTEPDWKGLAWGGF